MTKAKGKVSVEFARRTLFDAISFGFECFPYNFEKANMYRWKCGEYITSSLIADVPVILWRLGKLGLDKVLIEYLEWDNKLQREFYECEGYKGFGQGYGNDYLDDYWAIFQKIMEKHFPEEYRYMILPQKEEKKRTNKVRKSSICPDRLFFKNKKEGFKYRL